MTNLFVFHGMEELEHGSLTVQSLRKQSNLIVLVATFPIVLVVHIVLLLSPPIMLILTNPKILLLPSSYLDLFQYYLTFSVGFIISTIAQFWYALLPFRKSVERFEAMHQLYDEEMKARGITYKVIDQETYTLS